MRQNTVHFAPGDPLPASKHNALVAASDESGAALGVEHDAAHGHTHVRFEYSIVTAQWDGSAWIDLFGDRAYVKGSNSRTEVLVYVDDLGELFSHDHLGVIAQDSDGYVLPYSTSSRDGDSVGLLVHPRSASTEITVIVMGRRGFEIERVPGISWEDGSPAYALAGEHIGAEHINAATRWTRRYREAALIEHDVDGRHDRGYHCIASLEIVMPTWRAGNVFPPRVLNGQFQEHEHFSYSADPGNLFQAAAGGFGEMIVTLAIPLPSMDYYVLVGNTPEPFPFGDTGGNAGVGRRIFRFSRISDTEFSLVADAVSGGVIQAKTGSSKGPISIRIYAR